jgi:hypothetical protein
MVFEMTATVVLVLLGACLVFERRRSVRRRCRIDDLAHELRVMEKRGEALRDERGRAEAKVGALEAERRRLELSLASLRKQQFFLESLATMEVSVEMVTEVLGSFEEDSREWQAIMKLLHAQATTEVDGALPAGVDSEMRHYRAGRAAAALDLLNLLEMHRRRGRELVKKPLARAA